MGGPAPSKINRDSVAERMIDVAVNDIESRGMTVGLDRIRMEEIIKAAGVSRATAYRRWASREEFLADVLVETVERTSLIPETPAEVAHLTDVIERHWAEVGSPQGRRNLVVEALRVSLDLDLRRILASPRWRTFLSLCATYPGLPEGRVRDAVGSALTRTETVFAERRAQIYADLADLLGYRLVPPLEGAQGFTSLANATGATMTGVVTRALPAPAWLDQRSSATAFGSTEPAPWSEPERILVGVLLSHLEPDPSIHWDAEAITERRARFTARVREYLGS